MNKLSAEYKLYPAVRETAIQRIPTQHLATLRSVPLYKGIKWEMGMHL